MLRDELKLKVREILMTSATVEFEKNAEKWVYAMMSQDYYDTLFEKGLTDSEYQELTRQEEQEGNYPCSEVNAIFDEVETEVWGEVVCG